MSNPRDTHADAPLHEAIAQADAALEAVRRMNAAVAGPDVAAVVKGLEGIKQRAESRLVELQRQRAEREAATQARQEAKAMTPKQSDTEKRAQIESISEELNTSLRLGRIDAAIKELLAFFEDQDFFTANATTGRNRRLKALQNAIDKALAK